MDSTTYGSNIFFERVASNNDGSFVLDNHYCTDRLIQFNEFEVVESFSGVNKLLDQVLSFESLEITVLEVELAALSLKV